jgi:hypothetical protein
VPDLTFRRGAVGRVKLACVYCGAPATHSRERRVTNPRLDPPASSSSLPELPAGDDPISGCIALVLLPFLLIGLGKHARDSRRHRAALRAAPPLDPPDTIVTVTTCARHRRFGRRFVVAAVVGVLVLALGWGTMLLPAVREPIGPPLWLSVGVLVATLAFPIVFLMEYAGHGPVRVSRATRDEVTLSGVRQEYFDAPAE